MKRDDTIAAGWGLAEALLWFVVPDVFLTWVAVRHGVGRGLRLTVMAVAGAVVGGLIAYAWGAQWPEAGATAMSWLPGIDRAMVEWVADEVAAKGSVALLDGPRQAQPYKLYALAAGEQGVGVLALAWWTIPGRIVRFAVSSIAAGLAGHAARRWLSERFALAAWAVLWVAVYVVLWA